MRASRSRRTKRQVTLKLIRIHLIACTGPRLGCNGPELIVLPTGNGDLAPANITTGDVPSKQGICGIIRYQNVVFESDNLLLHGGGDILIHVYPLVFGINAIHRDLRADGVEVWVCHPLCAGEIEHAPIRARAQGDAYGGLCWEHPSIPALRPGLRLVEVGFRS